MKEKIRYFAYSESETGVLTKHVSGKSQEVALKIAREWVTYYPGHRVFYVENGKRVYDKELQP